MEDKKYIVTITLTDDSKIIEYQEFIWSNYEDKLNDIRTEFIQIGNSTINKKVIKSVKVSQNEEYVEEKKGEQ